MRFYDDLKGFHEKKLQMKELLLQITFPLHSILLNNFGVELYQVNFALFKKQKAFFK